MLIVKLVPALRGASLGAVSPVSIAVLHVTESSAPKPASGCTQMALPAATAVVSMMQVPAEVPVSQENDPDADAPQATVPDELLAAHFAPGKNDV